MTTKPMLIFLVECVVLMGRLVSVEAEQDTCLPKRGLHTHVVMGSMFLHAHLALARRRISCPPIGCAQQRHAHAIG